MSDLASLLQTSPYAASYMIGQQNNEDLKQKILEQQKLKELIAAQQQENSLNSQMNPLKIQQQQNLNNFDTQVKLPTGLAKLTSDQLANDKTQATQASDITATNAGNEFKTAQAQGNVAKEMQSKIMRIGATVSGAPAPMRMQAFTQALQQEGINPNTPLAQNMIQKMQSMDPNTFTGYIKQQADTFGNMAALQDAQYRATTESANTRAQAEVESAGIHAGATVQAAKIAADAKKAVATTKNQLAADWEQSVQAGKLDAGKIAATGPYIAKMLMQQANESDDPDTKTQLMAKAKRVAQTAAQAEQQVYQRAQAAGAGRNQLSDGKIVQQPQPTPQVASDPELASLLKDNVAVPGGANTQIQNAAQKAWGAYEPDKYDYRVGPNGQLQRKPKGQ